MSKKLFNLFSLLLLVGMLHSQNGIINNEERSFLINYLNVTEADLINTLSTITDEDWTFKIDDATWSPAQCMSHILQAENGLMKQIKGALQKPASPMPQLKQKDGWLISKVTDRGTKVNTPLEKNPELMERAVAIAALQKSRTAIKSFLKNEKLALRNHIGRSPYGPADSYQLLLVVAAHSMRHHNQILEVLAEGKKEK